MIREIVLIDFMSHTHSVIEPAPGLTVLVGPNNCGKSAVVTALKILSTNSTKSYMIRHGCKECAVTVETTDGHTITWRRKGATVNYTIDGQDIHRLKRDVPDGLYEILKLAPVTLADGEDSFDVHFARQKEPIFLLNGTGKQAAAFFASSSDASRLMEMQQHHKDRIRVHGQREKLLEQQAASIELQIEELVEVPVLQEEVKNATRDYQRLIEQINEIGRRSNAIDERAGLERVVLSVNAQCDALQALSEPPALQNAASLETLIDQASAAILQNAALLEQVQALVMLAPLRATTDPSDLEWLISAISAEYQAIDRGEAITAVLWQLLEVPAVVTTADLELMITSYEETSREAARRESEVQAMLSLPSPPILLADEALVTLLIQFNEAEADGKRHDAELNEACHGLGDVRDLIAHWSSKNPTCPTCGAVIHPDLWLPGTESHAHV